MKLLLALRANALLLKVGNYCSLLLTGYLPGRHVDVRNCIKVFQQVVPLDVGASESRSKESQAKVRESEEFSQTLHRLHSGVQGVHVDELGTCKHPEAGTHLQHHGLLFLFEDQCQSVGLGSSDLQE